MAIDWIFSHRPNHFGDMALYPALRERLEFYAKTGEFSHLVFSGEPGVGKTTAARILANLSNHSLLEVDCGHDNSKAQMLKVAKGTTAVNVFGTRRLIVMDEFDKVPLAHQTIFNKTMEDDATRNIFIFCVNEMKKVAPPIISRCLPLQFDIGVLSPNGTKLLMHPYTNMSKDEWIDELKRIGKIVAKKDGMDVSEEQLDRVAAVDLYLIDARRFLRALEEQIKIDVMKNKT